MNGLYSDIANSLSRTEVWIRLGFSDTASKYRRSILGPLWITLGMAITITGLGVFWSLIWKVDLSVFFPYLTAGILIWNFLVSTMVEGAVCFVQQAPVIRAAPLPMFIHPLRLAVKLVITLAHNSLVYVGVALIFKTPVDLATLLVLPGLALLFLFAVAAALLLGMIGARFRDFTPIVEAVMPLIFFLTPVLWFQSTLGSRAFIAELNPFTHFIAVVREPLLGHMPTVVNYSVVIGLTSTVWVVALYIFARCRKQISLWI